MEASEQKPTIFVVKTSIGHEKDVADAIAYRVKRSGGDVYSIMCPTRLRGYLLVEAVSPEALRRLIKGIVHVRGLVKGDTSVVEIEHLLAPRPPTAEMSVGAVVEIIAGPFKGEKARIQQIDETKEEITIELFESMVPIPITIRGDQVRILEKKEK